MERLSSLLQGIWPTPTRSFSHATRGGTWVANNVRQTASSTDLRAAACTPRSPRSPLLAPVERPKSVAGQHSSEERPAGNFQPEMAQFEQADPATCLSIPDHHHRRNSDPYTAGSRYHEGDHRPQHERKRHYAQDPHRPQFDADQQYVDQDRSQQQQAAQYYQEQYYNQQQEQYLQEQYAQEKHIQQQRAKQQQQEEAAKTYNKRKASNFLKNLFRVRPEAAPAQDFPKDPLPRNATRLDEVCNYHLGQLNRIKNELTQHNRNIDALRVIFQSVCEDEKMDDLDGTRYLLEERLKTAIVSRNALAKFVAFHLQEVERILVRKMELSHASSIPNLFAHLPTDAQWNEMFT